MDTIHFMFCINKAWSEGSDKLPRAAYLFLSMFHVDELKHGETFKLRNTSNDRYVKTVQVR